MAYTALVFQTLNSLKVLNKIRNFIFYLARLTAK